MIALFPGSFDPFTNGHLDVAERTAAIADRLIIGVGVNPAKRGFTALRERVILIKKATAHLPGVEVVLLNDATMDVAWARPSSSKGYAGRRTPTMRLLKRPSIWKSGV